VLLCLQISKISSLKNDIHSCKKEKDLLAKELEELKSEKLRIMETKDFLELALKRTEKTFSLMQKLAEDDDDYPRFYHSSAEKQI